MVITYIILYNNSQCLYDIVVTLVKGCPSGMKFGLGLDCISGVGACMFLIGAPWGGRGRERERERERIEYP